MKIMTTFGFLFAIGLSLSACVRATLPVSVINNMSPPEFDQSYPTSDVPVFPARNFTYCETKPRFKLGSGSFLTYMLRLKLCQVVAGRTWFEDSCANRTYNITNYYSAAYTKFCEPAAFEQQCANQAGLAVPAEDEAFIIVDGWMERNRIARSKVVKNATTAHINASSATPIDSADCKEINSFFKILQRTDVDETTRSPGNATSDFSNPFSTVQYTEWFLAYRAFCEPTACGVTWESYHNSSISAYDCYPSKCRSAIIFIMVFDSIIATLVVIANLLVLAVAVRTSIMRNIPGYFKISLAVADLMVGLFVLPGSVYHHYELSIVPLPYRSEGQAPQATDYFDQRYLNFMGIFTVLSFSVSVYTMGAASVDRYLAITKPFAYRQGKYLTKRRSISVFVVIWLFGFVCAIYPVFTSSKYTISALGLTLSTGFAAILVYAITLGLPLLAVWVINGAMLRQVCKEGKNRRTMSGKRITPSSVRKDETAEPKSVSRETENEDQVESTTNLADDDVFEASKTTNNNNIKDQKLSEKRTNKFAARHRFSQFTSSMQTQFKKRLGRSNSNFVNQANVESRLAKTLAVMIGAFTVAILPCIVTLALQPALVLWISPRSYPKTYSPIGTNIYTSAEYVASRLLLSNSFWNCIIYSIRNRHFRRALVDVFICDEERRRQRRRDATNTVNSSSYRGPRGRHLSKMASTDSGCVANSTYDERRRNTQVWDLQAASRKNSNETKAAKSVSGSSS